MEAAKKSMSRSSVGVQLESSVEVSVLNFRWREVVLFFIYLIFALHFFKFEILLFNFEISVIGFWLLGC